MDLMNIKQKIKKSILQYHDHQLFLSIVKLSMRKGSSLLSSKLLKASRQIVSFKNMRDTGPLIVAMIVNNTCMTFFYISRRNKLNLLIDNSIPYFLRINQYPCNPPLLYQIVMIFRTNSGLDDVLPVNKKFLFCFFFYFCHDSSP